MASPSLLDGDIPSQGAHAVRALLDRHGIPKHRHSAFVGEFFELSRAAAHQRVSKSTAWTLEELSALAEHFGETLAHVVTPLADAPPAAASPAVAAMMCIGAATAPCRIWLRPGNAPAPGDLFVALPTGGDYLVMPIAAAPQSHALRIARLEVDQSVAAARRVAIWDADSRACKKLCAQLQSEGMETRSFAAANELLAAANESGFDGYVVDWPPLGGDAQAVLSALRDLKRPSALILLSGRMRSAPEGIPDLAQAVVRYKAQFLEKPVQIPLLVSALRSGFSAV